MRRLSRVSPGLSLIVRIIWFVMLSFVAWRLTNWLLYESSFVTFDLFYEGGVSRDIPEEMIVVGVTVLVFLVMNFLIWLGYFMSVPSGRRRPTRATTFSRKPEMYR